MNTERTVQFLMANLGSELIRFFSLRRQGRQEDALASAQRVRLIINQLLLHKDIGNGANEVLVLKMLIEDALSTTPQYSVNDQELNSYFRPFAERVLTE